MDLTEQKCKPCEGGEPPFSTDEAKQHMAAVSGWRLEHNAIKKLFVFKNFKEAMHFVNIVADIAETEGHHPDIGISWNKVEFSLMTHAIKGLSLNDFIVAAKINKAAGE